MSEVERPSETVVAYLERINARIAQDQRPNEFSDTLKTFADLCKFQPSSRILKMNKSNAQKTPFVQRESKEINLNPERPKMS